MNKYSKDCKWCSEIFTSKQSKYLHEKNCKQNPDVDKLQCNGCGKKASRKDSLNRHHTGEYSMVILNSGATRVAGARGQVFQNKSIFLRRTMEDH